MKIFVQFSLLAALVSGCPKRTGMPPATSDEQLLREAGAQMEELKAKARSGGASCAESCGLVRKGCQLSEQTCEISARNPERADFRAQCISSQEDCVQFNDRCARCQS